MPVWLAVVFAAVSAAVLTVIGLRLVQILQLSSYQAGGFWNWFKRTKFDYAVRYFALAFFCFTSMFVFVMCFGKALPYAYIGYAFFLIICAYFIFSVAKEGKKTPLKFTPRVIRLLSAEFVLNCGISFALIWLPRNTAIMYSLLGLAPLLCPLTLMLAHFIMYPLEKLIGASFIAKAKKKLGAPIIIGITGSYGKTTAKNILARFLATKYKVFASPASFNTPMGLCKCINESYKGEEIFIAEMGARHSGDIAYLKRIFPPRYALLTAIGNQHLETFGSQENIIKEKLSLLSGVEYSVANGDCELIRENAGDGVHLCGEEGEASYSEVHSDITGTKFKLTVLGSTVEIATRLVGDHVPVAIAMCALMAHKLGVSLEEIRAAAEELPFIEHRLEVLYSGDMIILDDSYNSNPSGAENALKILSTFEGTKVIITPGFVELGDDSEACLKALGQRIAEVCDYAFLLGPNAEIIKSAIPERAYVVNSLDEAMELLKEVVPPFAVLFENDLPDNY